MGFLIPPPLFKFTHMDIYTYIAVSNPYQAKAILHKYGYSTQNVKDKIDLGVCLKSLVAYEGEDAFNDVLESHPDKNVLIERFQKEQKVEEKNFSGGCGCGCGGKCRGDMAYSNFMGMEQMSKSSKEVSAYILAAAILLAAAIIVKK